MAHRITHDQGRPAAGQRHDVVPVATHHADADRQVALRDLQSRRDLWPPREQPALEGERGAPLPVVQPGVVNAQRGMGGKLAGQHDLALREGGGGCRPPEHRASQHRPAGGERHRQ
jgi:hypothetical protein